MAYNVVKLVPPKTGTSTAVDTTGATLIVLCLLSTTNVGTQPTPTDSKSNIWTKAFSASSGDPETTAIWYCVNPTVGTGHTFTNGGANGQITGIALSNNLATSPLDAAIGSYNSGSTGAWQGGAVVPAVNNEIIITCAGGNFTSSLTLPSGYTTFGSPVNVPSGGRWLGAAYLIQTTAASANPTWTVPNGTDNIVVNACFKPAAGATVNKGLLDFF